MAKINSNYQKLQAGYLFPEIGKRVRAYSEKNPGAKVIRLGIGDVVLPLPAPIVDALKVAADELVRPDGSKCDTANIQEIFGLDNVVAVTDPVYPVYVDTSIMGAPTGAADAQGRFPGLVYLPCTAENNFDPAL